MHKLWWAALCAAGLVAAGGSAAAATVTINQGVDLSLGVIPANKTTLFFPGDKLPAVDVTVNQGDTLVMRFDLSSALTVQNIRGVGTQAIGPLNIVGDTSATVSFLDSGGSTLLAVSKMDTGVGAFVQAFFFGPLDLPSISGPFTFSSVVFSLGINLNGASSYHIDQTYLQFSGTDYSASDLAPAGIPEPTTWTLMVLGFGAAGAATRRRRSLVHSAA